MSDPKLGPDDIAAAERVLGIAYTEAERVQLARSMAEQIGTAQAARTISLGNSEAPALRFDPIPEHYRQPSVPKENRFRLSRRKLPLDPGRIAHATLTELAGWLKRRDITSRKLTEIYLERIARLDPELNSFALVLPARALAEADASDGRLDSGAALSVLDGIPYALKDLIDAARTETAWGSEAHRGRFAERDAMIVRRLSDAGAVLIGKTAVGALAYGDLWYGGRVRNPWNTAEGAVGSSAGSGAAVAGGLCAFAIGTETLGSITSPAERCGIAGLRPSFGRVSREGAMALGWSHDKAGPMARGTEDCAMILTVLAGEDRADRATLGLPPFRSNATDSGAGLRFGYLEAAYGDDAVAADHQIRDRLRSKGIDPVPVTLPDLPWASFLNLILAEAASAHEDITSDGRDELLAWQDDDAWPNLFRAARFLSAVDYLRLERLRVRVVEAVAKMFDEIDILIGPHETGPMLVASNLAGTPGLVLRGGFERRVARLPGSLTAERPDGSGKKRKVPRGIALWSGLHQEAQLIAAGRRIEAALGNDRSIPPGFS